MRKCQLPYSGYCVTSAGRGAPCCAMTPWGGEKHVSIKDVFKLPVFQEARDNEDKWPSVCKTCEFRYNNYGNYHGQTAWLHEPEDDVLSYLDIAFSNTCNLNCIMCSNAYSTRWNLLNAEMPEELWEFIKYEDRHYIHSLTYEEIDEILDHCHTLKNVVIKGGEPFYDKRSLYFLNGMKLINPDCEMKVLSNITNLNVDIINSFKKFKMICSIDGIFDVYEWVRGTPFATIVENFKTLIQLKKTHPNFQVGINYAVSAYNLECLLDTYHFFVDLGLRPDEFNITIAMEDHHNPRLLGKERVEKAAAEINKIFEYDITFDREATEKEKRAFQLMTELFEKNRNMKCPI